MPITRQNKRNRRISFDCTYLERDARTCLDKRVVAFSPHNKIVDWNFLHIITLPSTYSIKQLIKLAIKRKYTDL